MDDEGWDEIIVLRNLVAPKSWLREIASSPDPLSSVVPNVYGLVGRELDRLVGFFGVQRMDGEDDIALRYRFTEEAFS